MSWQDDNSFGDYQGDLYEDYLEMLGLTPGLHELNSLEYDPFMDQINYSYTTVGTGVFDDQLDDFSIGVIDGDPFGFNNQYMGGFGYNDFYDPGFDNYYNDLQQGQEYWESSGIDVIGEIQSRIDNNLMANARTVVFTTMGEYSGSIIGGNHFPANAYPGLGGLKIGGTGALSGYMPHIPLRNDRPPMAEVPKTQTYIIGGKEYKVPPSEEELARYAERRFKAELGQYFFGSSTPQEANYFIQQYAREYAPTLGISEEDALTWVSEMLDSGQLKDLPLTYDKNLDGSYVFENTTINNPKDLNFYNVSDSTVKQAGAYREFAIASGADVYSEIPSSNVPDRFNVAIGSRVYRTEEPDEFGRYNYFIDKIETDPRLNKVEQQKINVENNATHVAPLYVTEAERQISINKARDQVLLKPEDKDSFVDNVLAAAAALTGDPVGAIGSDDLAKAVWSSATSSANPALGVLNILSFVQDGMEAVASALAGKDVKIGGDIPDARDVIKYGSNLLGIDLFDDISKVEARQQSSIRKNYTRLWKDGKIEDDFYAELEKNYQDFLAGKGFGNNMPNIEGVVYGTNDINSLLNYEINLQTPFQRSQSYLKEIEKAYINGEVSDWQLLDAYNKHKDFIGSMGNNGVGVTKQDVEFVTGKEAIHIPEAPLSYDINFEVDYEVQLPRANNEEEQIIFNEAQEAANSKTYNNTEPQLNNYYKNVPENAVIDPSLYTNLDGTVNTQRYVKALGVTLNQLSEPGDTSVTNVFDQLVNKLKGTVNVGDSNIGKPYTPLLDVIEKELLNNTTLTSQQIRSGNLPSEIQIKPGREKLNIDDVMENLSTVTNSNIVRINEYITYDKTTKNVTDVLSESFTPIKQYNDQQIYIDEMGRLRDEKTNEEINPVANYTPQQKLEYDSFIEKGFSEAQAMLEIAGQVSVDQQNAATLQQANYEEMRELIGTSDFNLSLTFDSIVPEKLPTSFQLDEVEVPILPVNPAYVKTEFKPQMWHEYQIEQGNQYFIDNDVDPYGISYTDSSQIRIFHGQQERELDEYIRNELTELDLSYATSIDQAALALMNRILQFESEGLMNQPYPDGYWAGDRTAKTSFQEISEQIIVMAFNDKNPYDFGGFIPKDASTTEKLEAVGKLNNIIFDNINRLIVEQFANDEEYFQKNAKGGSHGAWEEPSRTAEELKEFLATTGKIIEFREDDPFFSDGDVYTVDHWASVPLTFTYTGWNGNKLGDVEWGDNNQAEVVDNKIVFNTTNQYEVNRSEDFVHPLYKIMEENLGVKQMTTDLLNQITDLDKKTIELQGKINDAEISRNELATLAEERGLTINALIDQVSSKQAEIQQAEQQASQAQQEADAAQAELQAKQQELTTTQNELTQVQTDLQQLQASGRPEDQQQLQQLQGRYDQLVAQQTELSNSLQTLEASYQTSIQYAQVYFDAKEEALEAKKDLEQDLKAEKEANQQLNTQLTEAGKEVELVKGQLSDTQTQLKAAKAEKEAKQAELDGVNQTLDNLDQLYKGKISELEFKQKQLDTITTQRDAIQEALQIESGKLATSQADLTNAQNLLSQKETEHATAVAELEKQRDAAVAKGESDVEATATRLNEEKAAEITALREQFANTLQSELNTLGAQLNAEKANELASAEQAHKVALETALAAAGTEAEAEKLAELKAQGDRLALAQQAALDDQKTNLELEALNNLTTQLQSQKLEIEALAAEELANTKKDYDAQIEVLNSNFEKERGALQNQIDVLNTNATIYTNRITQLDADVKTANENLQNKTQQYNAEVEINTFKQGLIDDLESKLGIISSENLAYVNQIAELKVAHQGEKDAAFNEYQTNLTQQEQSLTTTYTQQLQNLRQQLEDQAAADIAAKEAELQAEKESELQAQAQAAQAKLEEDLAAARADEQLKASGQLAARESELQAQYEIDLQAAQQKAESDLQAAVAAETTRQEGILAQQIADLQTSLNAQHAQAKADLKIQLQTEYQSALNAQAVAHNDQIAQLNADHEDTVAALRSQLEGEKALAIKQVEDDAARQISDITAQHAIDLQNAETQAQARYDAKLEEELGKANADYEAASAAAEQEANAYLNSERERLTNEKDAKVAEVTASYEATIAANEENYNTQIGSLQSENDALRLTIEELTPPPPMYLGIDGEDYRVIDEEERAYLDKLKEEGLSGQAHNVLNLPTLYNYEGNVVYNPSGFNDEDLWASDQIQKLYYEGFPQTEAELVDLIKRNPDIFGEVDADGSNTEIASGFIQKVKDGIMDVGYALQQVSGGKIGTSLLNLMGFFVAGGVPLGNILNAAGDIFGPDTAIELAKTLQRQVNNRRNFSDNKIVEWDEIMRIHLDEKDFGLYDPADFTDPNHPDNEDIINMAQGTTGTATGPGGTNVTGNVTYSDVNLGDPTDYLYQILRIIEGPEVAERFKGKGMSDPEGFELISKYLDQTTLDAAIRANAIDEVALFGTDEQRGSIEIQGDAAEKIQDIAQALRDDQALSDIELINKYGAQAAEAIKGLDPDRLEQQSLLQDLAKKRLQEAIDFDPEVLPQEKLIGEAATSLLEDVRSESLIEKAVKEAALGQLDVNLTEGEAAIKKQALDYLNNAGKLSDREVQEIEDNISTGLRARGRLDSDFGLMQEIVGRTQAELDREDKDVALGLGLYGEFDQLYGGRLARGATLGTAGESLTAARRADNRATVAAGTELVGQLYNFENNRIQQQNAKDTMAANLQQEYDRQAAATTGDVFGMLLGSLSASPYGTTALSTVGGNVTAPTNLTNLTSMASQDYANAQTFGSTMEGLSALQAGSRDYMNFLTQGMQGYSQASSSGVNPYVPSFSNSFEGFGDLNFGQKVGVINQGIEDVQGFFGGGGFTGDPNTTVIDTFKGGFTGNPDTNVLDFIKGGFTGDPNTNIFDSFFN